MNPYHNEGFGVAFMWIIALFIVFPAIMLANNLTDKLIGLLRYEIISITTIRGNKTIGTPLGTNNFK